MASIYKRELGDGSLRYDVFYRDPDGHQRSKTFRTWAGANNFASTVEADKLRGQWIDPNAGKIRFQEYAEEWLSIQDVDLATAMQMRSRLENHVYPVLGRKQLRNVKPSTIQGWSKGMDLADRTRSLVFGHVQAILDAAIDDELIAKNPCKAKSVTRPQWTQAKVVPWKPEQVIGVREALPRRYQITAVTGSGLGLRQGESFGLSPEDFDLQRRVVFIQRQVKLIGYRHVFAPPKYGKEREVPLSEALWDWIEAYMARFPVREVTLPWKDPDKGKPVTVPMLLTSRESKPPTRGYFNARIWKPALISAGLEPVRSNGTHALRHFFASVLLDAGESIKALSEYLGHADPGFTLRVYTHLMPTSAERTRRAIDGFFAQAV